MDIQTVKIVVNRKHNDRYLTTVSLTEIAAVLQEPLTVLYTNVMEPGAVAGHHLHHHKREAFQAAFGMFEVFLEDPVTKERQIFLLDATPGSPRHHCLIVPAGIAHAVRNLSLHTAGLNVFATDEPRKPEDDFPYRIALD